MPWSVYAGTASWWRGAKCRRKIRFGIPVNIDRAGANVVEIEVEPLADELTMANNRAVVHHRGYPRETCVSFSSRASHMQVSGPGAISCDPMPMSISSTSPSCARPRSRTAPPIDELSLIAFPTRELFQDKIAEFDLIIFDRYANQSILPSIYYDNIVRYVREGGAVLLAAGPEFAGRASLARTRLSPIIPSEPTGTVLEEAYKALLTDIGERHPVTRGLPGSEADPPAWGEWLRILDSRATSGQTLLSGAQERPLLVLERQGEGRVALLLSDHAWLWARGYRDGGPYIDLLRRTSHWLMREPALEEEALRAQRPGRTDHRRASNHVRQQSIRCVSSPRQGPSARSFPRSLNPVCSGHGSQARSSACIPCAPEAM